ncbi:hypothetical protein [Kitasatospora sp. HPMI-4]|uniref:hypothetical protein n=1 Tax=Kitasatospora sp. HPMI-4 TaxID=3448443 RepID=UPI003F1B67B5
MAADPENPTPDGTAPTGQSGDRSAAKAGDPAVRLIAETAERLVRLWASCPELHHAGWDRPFRPLGELLPEQDVEFAAQNPQMVPLLWYPALRHGTPRAPVIDVFDHLPAESGPPLPRRQELSRIYSWALASRTALDWIGDCLEGRGLLEVGAGSGYWAWLLRARGVDVLATDAEARAEHNGWTDRFQFTEVRPGRAAEDAAAHPERVLALLWPPHRDPMAADALHAYQGSGLFYLGDGAGGICADDSFFTELAARWRPLSRCPLTLRWLGNRDTATFYVRR